MSLLSLSESTLSKNKPVHILLVEDDDVDAEAMVRAFRKQKIANPITHVDDGIKALAVLRGEEGRERLPRPYLILLDINMPRMNGIEFLQVLRKDQDLERSIVFMLTTSNRDEDKLAAYDEQIAGYLLKNRAGEEFADLISMLNSYWRVVEFPPEA
ncbi:MAG: response regulator [Caldilineaceae bacterium]|nr:response regulator [Caldilineaceae bacterium]